MTEPTTQLLEKIAKKHLGIDTLTPAKSDAADFHDVACWSVEAALRAAFAAGRAAAGDDAKAVDGLRSALQWFLDDMHDAGATITVPSATGPVGVEICDSAMNAARALTANGGTPPFKVEA